MSISIRHFRLNTLLHLWTSIIFVVASVVTVTLVNHYMREQAMTEAREKARLILNRNLATHHYFSRLLKPDLFKSLESILTDEDFDPVWMSSTWAVRQMDEFFQTLSARSYYYKECAINARMPQNEADEHERSFLTRLQSDPELIELFDVRELDGEPYFVALRRGEVMEKACLRCHSTPAEAPSKLVTIYGGERSFGRSEGEVVSAVSIRVPLAEAYATANQFSLRLSGMLLVILALLFLTKSWLYRNLLFKPLVCVQRTAARIAETGTESIGEQIPIPTGEEIANLAIAFNQMSCRIAESVETLEERVAERTAELHRSNADLSESLAQVKKLHGMLPICMHCKKIRDDEGYWSQIESYITERSEAIFSHGICPNCVTELYPDYDHSEGPPETQGEK